MESELFAEFAGLDGHEGNDYSGYANLHAYIERPDDFYKKLFLKNVLDEVCDLFPSSYIHSYENS